jgi:hypothetical protein
MYVHTKKAQEAMKMRLQFHVTGAERKSLVAAISQELNAPTKYLGMPTAAYEVGGYHIDKNGTVTGKDNLDLEDALYQKGFNAKEREYDEPDTYESGLGGMGATPSIEDLNAEAAIWAEREMRRLKLENENVPDHSNRGQYDGDDIPENWEDGMTEREELGLGRTRRENYQGENGMRPDECGSNESDTLTIEMPLDGFADESIANLEKLIASKSNLIKKAIGAEDLPVERTETTLRFPWFSFEATSEEVSAYARFIGALCAAAKTQKRVTAREKLIENEKFAFRVFLIRLGFVGDEYKSARKILLCNLNGNSAYAKIRSEVPHE